jgi:hypothetical protein
VKGRSAENADIGAPGNDSAAASASLKAS